MVLVFLWILLKRLSPLCFVGLETAWTLLTNEPNCGIVKLISIQKYIVERLNPKSVELTYKLSKQVLAGNTAGENVSKRNRLSIVVKPSL